MEFIYSDAANQLMLEGATQPIISGILMTPFRNCAVGLYTADIDPNSATELTDLVESDAGWYARSDPVEWNPDAYLAADGSRVIIASDVFTFSSAVSFTEATTVTGVFLADVTDPTTLLASANLDAPYTFTSESSALNVVPSLKCGNGNIGGSPSIV